MPSNDRDYDERDPHPDGRYEGIINDNTAMAGEKMGVIVDTNSDTRIQPNNPYHINPKVDSEMEKFNTFFKSNK
ncbi:hypothetical protein [Fredinandcohnia quinoae]|uniref:Uncharacterized protein n=1 Tax=Fredinandcohnia quinoae TaxID=2918902 RepID=A0AAW5DZW8_9BACI|nr:hypothetical protein [Fredinandcohnia sp. SECRCQ15]MCH1623974.1 hypothetical protein [Fredinandcohnia sp. SECRCQ15]